MSNTVLLIHGAWLNSRSWDAVKARYEAKGFTVVAPIRRDSVAGYMPSHPS